MKPLKILLVDDSKSARYALRLQFKRHNIEVDLAESAEEALERVKTNRPEAIFMDHTMPGMSGLEALEALKADPDTARIPVVMCTSNEEPEYLALAKEKGAVDVLAKSAAQEKLPAILEHLEKLLEEQAAPPEPEIEPPAASEEATPAPALDQAAIEALVREEVARAVAQIELPAPPTPPEPPMDAEAITELVRREVARGIEDHLEAALEPMARDLQERLEASQEGMIQATVTPLLTETSESLRAEILSETENLLRERVTSEAERIQAQMLELQDQQSQQLEQRLTNEVLPGRLAEALEVERNQLIQIAQQFIDQELDRLTESERFTGRVREIAETLSRSAAREAVEAAEKQVEALNAALAAKDGKMYALTGVAAALGILAAVGVFFALS